MAVIEKKELNDFSPAKVTFFRITPGNLTLTLRNLLYNLMDISWLNSFDKDYLREAFSIRAGKTIADIEDKFIKCVDDEITSEAGEYVVSELARETIINELNYLDIPLAELLGKKKSENPGFDFHSGNPINDLIIFGEAKYVAKSTAYSSALIQICEFIEDKKDIQDLPELEHYVSDKSCINANNGIKGFAAAFSAKSTKTDTIIENIVKRNDFKQLLKYEELILVAVNL